MSLDDYEEEDFEQQKPLNRSVLRRILSLALPHWRWVAEFLTLVTASTLLDSYSTYLSKRILDEGNHPAQPPKQ